MRESFNFEGDRLIVSKLRTFQWKWQTVMTNKDI